MREDLPLVPSVNCSGKFKGERQPLKRKLSTLKTYRCKHAVEAMRWTDTDENREAFATWFEKHGAMFSTRGPEVVLPEEGTVSEGEWILYSDDEFIVMEDELFTDMYEEIP